jgi:hypothetical protein
MRVCRALPPLIRYSKQRDIQIPNHGGQRTRDLCSPPLLFEQPEEIEKKQHHVESYCRCCYWYVFVACLDETNVLSERIQ